MKATLLPSWELTTEHSASSYGQPVLVNRSTGDAFGPGDIVKPYPSWGFMTAADAVQRMLKMRPTQKGAVAVERFLGSMVKQA